MSNPCSSKTQLRPPGAAVSGFYYSIDPRYPSSRLGVILIEDDLTFLNDRGLTGPASDAYRIRAAIAPRFDKVLICTSLEEAAQVMIRTVDGGLPIEWIVYCDGTYHDEEAIRCALEQGDNLNVVGPVCDLASAYRVISRRLAQDKISIQDMPWVGITWSNNLLYVDRAQKVPSCGGWINKVDSRRGKGFWVTIAHVALYQCGLVAGWMTPYLEITLRQCGQERWEWVNPDYPHDRCYIFRPAAPRPGLLPFLDGRRYA